MNETYNCFEIEGINNCDIIPDDIKKECAEKFNKNCYFKLGTTTKVGKLIGIRIDFKLKELYYILEDARSKYYMACENTTLKRL